MKLALVHLFLIHLHILTDCTEPKSSTSSGIQGRSTEWLLCFSPICLLITHTHTQTHARYLLTVSSVFWNCLCLCTMTRSTMQPITQGSIWLILVGKKKWKNSWGGTFYCDMHKKEPHTVKCTVLIGRVNSTYLFYWRSTFGYPGLERFLSFIWKMWS